jgi:hypothetical protein
MRTPLPSLDVQLTLDDLQYDVWSTLATLALYAQKEREATALGLLQQFRGVLGPVVLAGRGNNESMRVSYWIKNNGAPMIMLIPEAYVQVVLADYNSKRPSGHGQALLCSQGFLVLSNVRQVPIEFSGLTPSELDGERVAFGPRLWSVSHESMDSVLPELHSNPEQRNGLVAYRTQSDADAEWTRGLLQPGARVGTSATHSIFYTNTTSDDQLSGLRVCWAAGDRPVLDVDTVSHGAQSVYERFSS